MQIDGPTLRELLDYDPETGLFTWRTRSLKWFKSERSQKSWNVKWAGKPAGRINNGYVIIGLLGVDQYAHRLAGLYMKGVWPLEIDHVDRDGTNNAWDNLDDSDRFRNNQNKGIMATNTSGFTGVTRSLNKWQAKITRNGVETYLGTFDTPEEAAQAYRTAEENI